MALDKNGLYGIYDIWHVPFWQTRLFYDILAGIGSFIFIILLLLVVRWYRARRRQRTMSAWEKALVALERLKQEEYTTTEQGKYVYFTITEVLKDYLHDRYHYDVQGKTDDELLAYLQEQQFEKELLDHFQDIVNGGVMVKFANEQALTNQIEQHLGLASVIIKQTIPTTN